MLYELIAVVRPGNLAEVKEIARTAGSLILRNGGTIRALNNWGVWSLPKKTRKHQAQYTDGHYFIMRYDASSKIQDDVRMTLGLDPRMIKFSTVKLGDGTLESISKLGSSIPWKEGSRW
ncbi:37S ribosomal protein-like protein Mrp17 [Acephala macrosclerotiorum]|nr:37S ribosomal protein-like protein Mrp17 [Acephala macrosclerotiorum]